MSPPEHEVPPASQASRPPDAVLLVGSAGLFGAYVSAAPGATLVAAIAILCVLWRRASRLTLGVSVAAFALAAFRAQEARSDYEVRHAVTLSSLNAPARCAGNARVVSSPTVRGETTSYLADFDALDCEGRRLAGPLRARLYSAAAAVHRGDVRAVVAQLAPVQVFRNFGVSDPTWYAARQGAVLSGGALSDDLEEAGDGWRVLVDRARAHSRSRIEATFAPAVVPMARALVLGENDLDPEDDEAFRKSGLAHLLAVSGTHLVFAVLMLVRALTFLLVRIETLAARFEVARLAACAGALLALLYADFAGGSGSAWRAAFMLSAAFGVRVLGRRPSIARSVAASLIAGTSLDPLAAFDLSFLLSVAATAGLCLIGGRFAGSAKHIAFRPARYLVLSVLATLSAMIPCAPLLALLSPHQTLAGIAANVVAGPLGEIIALPLCLAHSLFSGLPSVEAGAATVASGALVLVRAVALTSAGCEALAWVVPPPNAWQLALILVAATLVVTRTRGGGRSAAVLAGLVALCAGFGLWRVERELEQVGAPTAHLRVTMLDVGQGDSLLVDLPDGRLMLVDGGGFVGSPVDPGRSVILPVLRARRRSHIDVMVLSHPHPDHFTGLLSVAETLPVKELWDTGQGEKEEAGPVYRRLLETLRDQGTLVRRPRELCGAPHLFGTAEVRVLAPCPEFVPARGANDNSLVLRLQLGTRVVLMTGDAEAAQESELVTQYGGALHADLLKVGHHGSRTSSTEEFLRTVQPELALVSSGVRNRFGHPHAAALERLSATGVRVERTDQRGALEWVSDGVTVRQRAFQVPINAPGS